MKMANPSALAREFMEHGRSESCPIVDMHGHLGPYFGGYLPSAPLEKMLATMEKAGVSRIVCSSHDALFLDVDQGNALTQKAIDRAPDAILGYWAINPNYPQALARAPRELQQAHGFVGFKFLPDYHCYPLDGDAYAPILEYANEHRLLVLVHTWGGSAFNSPDQVATVAGKYPEAIILMGHSGYGQWTTALQTARDFPNVYLELTAVYVAHDWAMQPAGSGAPSALMSYLHINGIIERMVDVASSKKIVFGTDLPWYSPHYAAGSILFARIDDNARHDILHRNAERILSKEV